MVKDTKAAQKEITERLSSKGLDKFAAMFGGGTLKATPEKAKPVEFMAQTGGGAIADLGNKISEEQKLADFEAKHGDVPEYSAEDAAKKGNMAKHDEDLDNLISALSMFIPADVLSRGGSELIGGLIKKLGTKNFKADAVEAALEKVSNKSKEFTSHKIPELQGKAKIDTWLDTKPAYERRAIDKNANTDIMHKVPEEMTTEDIKSLTNLANKKRGTNRTWGPNDMPMPLDIK